MARKPKYNVGSEVWFPFMGAHLVGVYKGRVASINVAKVFSDKVIYHVYLDDANYKGTVQVTQSSMFSTKEDAVHYLLRKAHYLGKAYQEKLDRLRAFVMEHCPQDVEYLLLQEADDLMHHIDAFICPRHDKDCKKCPAYDRLVCLKDSLDSFTDRLGDEEGYCDEET